MITIREIIHLCKLGQLKDCIFYSDDSSQLRIEVKNGVAFFKQKDHEPTFLESFSKEELIKIDQENNYYVATLFDEMKFDETAE